MTPREKDSDDNTKDSDDNTNAPAKGKKDSDDNTNVPAKGKGKKGKKKLPLHVANGLSEMRIKAFSRMIDDKNTSPKERGIFNYLRRRENEIMEARNGRKEKDDILSYFNE